MSASRETHDLAWAISGPRLLQQSIGSLELPPDLPPTPVPTNHRVGYYFEDLVRHYLRHRPDLEVLVENQQIQEGTRTLGEVDFIFRDLATGRVHHWETAIKFYLHFPDAPAIESHYIGPNANDDLERKTARLLEHQLPTAKRAFPEIDEQAVFVRGILFYRSDATIPPPHPLLNPDHLRGLWLWRREIDQLESLGQGFARMEKPYWLTPPDAADDVDFSEIRAQLADLTRPQMLSVRSASGEEPRVFVVPDDWPTRG